MSYLDLQAAQASITAAAPTFTALAACTGDTLQVRTLSPSQKAELLDFGFQGASAQIGRVRSPYFHDDVQGIRARFLASDPSGLTGTTESQLLRPQDTLIVEATGTGAATQFAYWQLAWYSDLAGGPSTYITGAELKARMIEEVTNEVPVTSGAAGQWGSALLSTGTGVLKANASYAVIGYVLDVACLAWGLFGADTGNFRAGGPGVTTRQFTRTWFVDLSRDTGLPCIPVINAQNAGGTQVQVNHITAATAVNVDLILGRLK